MPATNPGDDHLAHLHKMSTTAGVGSGDYVAVNIPAVVAILLGVASSLCLLDPIFLIVPLAGAICAIMSLMQIRRSSGTQTGTLLAVGGLVLALAFAGFVGYRELNSYLADRREEAAIVSVISQFEADAKSSNWAHAYTLFDPKFTKSVNEKQFADTWGQFENSPFYGHVASVVWNGHLVTFTDNVSGGRFARALTRFHYTRSAETVTAHEFLFHLDSGTWKIQEISSFFGAPPFN